MIEDKYIDPFLTALVDILGSFNITDIKKGAIRKKENMHVEMDITSVVGLTGSIKGNVAYSLSQDTAKGIVSAMMMGMEINELDDLSRSAIGEMANMVTGTASSLLAKGESPVDITPPSIIFGEDMYFIISPVETIAVEMETSCGKIEINIGIEV